MQIIAIANNKGGVAKTTTARNFAGVLVEQGKQVLLVDADDQGNLSYALNAPEDYAHSIGQFLLVSPEQVRTWPYLTPEPGLSFLPSHEELDEHLEQLRKKKNYRQLLRERLANVPATQFDYIIIDCPPNLTDGMTEAALIAADAFVVPVEPEPFAVRGLKKIMERAQELRAKHNPQLRFIGFVFTRFNAALKGQLRQSMFAAVKAKYGEDSVLPAIRQSVPVSEAHTARQSVLTYAPDSAGAEDYRTLTTTILERL